MWSQSQAEDGIRDIGVTGVQTCALPIWTDPVIAKMGIGLNRAPFKEFAKVEFQNIVPELVAPLLRQSLHLEAIDIEPRFKTRGQNPTGQIGRASCRERVKIYVVAESSRRRHTRYWRDWSSDVCSSDLDGPGNCQNGDRFEPCAIQRVRESRVPKYCARAGCAVVATEPAPRGYRY